MPIFRFDPEVSPSLTASFFMASALCFHFFGYEMARAASIALLAAKDIGLGSGALSFTVAVGSPISAMVLFLYARSIKRNGPRVTLLVSNICCVILLGLMSIACGSLKGGWGQSAVLLFYCFREIYVSLLSTQQWSFIASVLDSKTSNYLVTFAGVVSVASAVGGCSVEYLVSLGGVRALLITAFVSCGLSFTSAEIGTYLASSVNEEGKSRIHSGLSKFSQQSTKDIVAGTSADTIKVPSKKEDTSSDTATAKEGVKKEASKGFWRKSLKLLMKHETLQLLFAEALIHQCCSNMLNMMFYDGLRTGIPLDSERAVLVGRFFASVNIAACFLQVFVMPSVLSVATLPKVLCSIPIVIFGIVIGGYIYPSLLTVMFGFGALKVLEYSIMTSATEMIYMPMSSEQRYLGKELIRFFGHRMGKSAAVMILSAASAHFKPSMATQSLWGGAITAMWSGIMFVLSRHLALRNDTSMSKSNVEEEEVELLIPVTAIESEKMVPQSHAHTNKRLPLKEFKSDNENITGESAQSVSGVRDAPRLISSYDEDTTSESETDGENEDSSDSLSTYYMPGEEVELDPSTQDCEGKTLTITPSFSLLTALEKDPAVISAGVKAAASAVDRSSAESATEEDYADFVVLDNDNGDYDQSDAAAEGRETNDTFLRFDPTCAVYDVEERHLQDEGLRRRVSPSNRKIKSSRKTHKSKREKRSSDNLTDLSVVKSAISHKDLLSTIRRVHSTVKTGGKKLSDGWMTKINGSETQRPLMFRVGSTCMTMSNLVNENRERSTKSEEYKK